MIVDQTRNILHFIHLTPHRKNMARLANKSLPGMLKKKERLPGGVRTIAGSHVGASLL
ncbi:hypothetical protein [Sphingobium nicotianae]|uniref:hypothetical protein n=1 Tax=Sphingobium nicotianae TaxID=2782607 RepID=UPI001BE461E8|nr:hypothetical protein [Sphingobium nicotianae]